LKEINYIYFVDLTDQLVCRNIIKTNGIMSPYIIHYITYKTEYPLYSINLDNLLTELDADQIGFVSPRFQYITLSNWVRNDLKIGIGVTNSKMYSKSDIERIHRIAELEIEFEKLRRIVNKNLPSRLSCIYLAEDSFEGRTMLKNMFLNKKLKFHITEVEITVYIAFHKADSKWVEHYEKTKDVNAIINYWLGKDFNNSPEYEYLVEGILNLKNESDRKYIEENCEE
jgi:hypothetical protein